MKEGKWCSKGCGKKVLMIQHGCNIKLSNKPYKWQCTKCKKVYVKEDLIK